MIQYTLVCHQWWCKFINKETNYKSTKHFNIHLHLWHSLRKIFHLSLDNSQHSLNFFSRVSAIRKAFFNNFSSCNWRTSIGITGRFWIEVSIQRCFTWTRTYFTKRYLLTLLMLLHMPFQMITSHNAKAFLTSHFHISTHIHKCVRLHSMKVCVKLRNLKNVPLFITSVGVKFNSLGNLFRPSYLD